MDCAQPLMFAEDELPRYVPGVQDVRARMQATLDKMRAAASWPWKASTVRHYRETVWPSLLGKLPEDEAARLLSEIKAEAARLDSVL